MTTIAYKDGVIAWDSRIGKTRQNGRNGWQWWMRTVNGIGLRESQDLMGQCYVPWVVHIDLPGVMINIPTGKTP